MLEQRPGALQHVTNRPLDDGIVLRPPGKGVVVRCPQLSNSPLQLRRAVGVEVRELFIHRTNTTQSGECPFGGL